MSKYITELANDIAKSCPDLVENGCGNDNCVACLAFKLTGLGYQKQEWISVEERLPQKHESVLVYCDGAITEDFRCSAGSWYDHYDRHVTHWMPLPESPSNIEVKDYPPYLDRPKKGGAE